MDKAKGDRFKGGRWGWWDRGHGGVKMETAVLEQQSINKIFKKLQ